MISGKFSLHGKKKFFCGNFKSVRKNQRVSKRKNRIQKDFVIGATTIFGCCLIWVFQNELVILCLFRLVVAMI